MKIIVSIFFSFLLLAVKADNLRLSEVKSLTSNEVSFALSWSNSWRTAYNYDAIYVFCKYRHRSVGDWQHLQWSVSTDGHTINEGYEIKPINEGRGVLVFRNVESHGESIADIKLRIQANIDLLDEDIEISLHGIEMVYLPTVPFYTSDTTLYSGFQSSFSSSYPTGESGFYSMKYELTQEQYVVFLNQLNRSAQYARTIGGSLDGLKNGDYLFGNNRKVPSHRNGIIVHQTPSSSASSYIFACNLDGTDVAGSLGDGQGIACNFLNIGDMLAYADWSGLRPLSELEYEKMCRGTYPMLPSKDEYAWGTSAPVFLSSLSDGDTENENPLPTTANVNAGNQMDGPIRVGAFVRPGIRSLTGNSFWGISDLSGNLSELYINTAPAGQTFNGDVHGCGFLSSHGSHTIDTSSWPFSLDAFHVRGGDFSSDGSELLVAKSNSSSVFFDTLSGRNSKVGFRLGVQPIVSVVSSNLTLENGLVSNPARTINDTVCDASVYTIRGEHFPSESGGNYSWYSSRDQGTTWSLLENKTQCDLELRDLITDVSSTELQTFLYKRIDYSIDTIRKSNIVGLVVGYGYHINRLRDTLQPCMDSCTFEITAQLPTSFKWYNVTTGKLLQSTEIGKSSNYAFEIKDFSEEGELSSNRYDISIEMEIIGKCRILEPIEVVVLPYTSNPFPSTVENVKYIHVNTHNVLHTWSGKDQMEWKLVNSNESNLTIDPSTGILSGLTENPFFEIEVQLRCKDYPDRWYRKTVQESERKFVYTGNYQRLNLWPGEYTIECTGGEGSRVLADGRPYGSLGKGGYVKGTLELTKEEIIFIYIGGSATIGSGGSGGRGGWNGGGHGGLDTDNDPGGAGGGGTDIRLIAGAWNELTSLRSRIMVAGGGFGFGSDGSRHPSWSEGGGGGGYYGGYGFVSGMEGCDAVDINGTHTAQSKHYSGLIFFNASMINGVGIGHGVVNINRIK